MRDDGEIIAAFAAEHVVRLTGLTTRQLSYWDRTGFFRPQFSSGGNASSRVYSFKDIVGLRTIALLRTKYRVSLPHLRSVAEKLSAYSTTPWADIKLKVWERQVYFDEPDTGKTVGILDGQYVLLPIQDVISEMRARVSELGRRDETDIGKIERHRRVSHNAPVIAGTRIKVSSIMRFHDAGYSVEAIVGEYPSLTEQDIRAAIEGGSAKLAA